MKTPKAQPVPVPPVKPARKPPKSRVGGVRLLVEDWDQINAATHNAKQNFSDWARKGLLDLSDPLRIDFRALLLKYMRSCMECDGITHLMDAHDSSQIGITDAEYESLCGLSEEAEALRPKLPERPSAPVEQQIQFIEPVDSTDGITCQTCGHTHDVRRIPQFNGPSLPGEDPGCPLCAARVGLTPQEVIDMAVTVGTGFMKVEFKDMPPEPFPSSLMIVKNMSSEEFAEQYPPKCSWHSEFAAMNQMEPAEAMGRFRELLDGRTLPKGFVKMSRPEQIRWLEKEMPL